MKTTIEIADELMARSQKAARTRLNWIIRGPRDLGPA